MWYVHNVATGIRTLPVTFFFPGCRYNRLNRRSDLTTIFATWKFESVYAHCLVHLSGYLSALSIVTFYVQFLNNHILYSAYKKLLLIAFNKSKNNNNNNEFGKFDQPLNTLCRNVSIASDCCYQNRFSLMWCFGSFDGTQKKDKTNLQVFVVLWKSQSPSICDQASFISFDKSNLFHSAFH